MLLTHPSNTSVSHFFTCDFYRRGMSKEKRCIRIANVSGAVFDAGFHMYNQAINGPIDAITGDYLSEINMGSNAQAYHADQHSGWEKTAEDGLMQTLEVIATKKLKVRIRYHN